MKNKNPKINKFNSVNQQANRPPDRPNVTPAPPQTPSPRSAARGEGRGEGILSEPAEGLEKSASSPHPSPPLRGREGVRPGDSAAPTVDEPQPHSPIESSTSRPRVGKIARLPKIVRDELNERIAEGEGGETLLEWLNGLERTQEILAEKFDGMPISKQNLSDWRHGGHAEWLLRRALVDDARELCFHANDIEEAGGSFMADDLVTVFTARYAALISRWDGEATEEFSAKVKIFSRLRRDLLLLQKSAHAAAHNKREWENIEKEERAQVDQEARDYALAPFKAMKRRSLMSQAYGKFGEAYADALDSLDYPDHPFFNTDDDESPDESAKRERARSKSKQPKRSKKPEPPANEEASRPAPKSEPPKQTDTNHVKDAAAKETNAASNNQQSTIDHQPIDNSQPFSQAMPNSAQAIAPKPTSPQKPLAESSLVKPLNG